MALKDYLPRWLKRIVGKSPLMGGLHDAVQETFTEIQGDLAAMDADTVIAEASEAGLDRWSRDLDEPRLPGETVTQWRDALQAVYEGDMTSGDAFKRALDRFGVPYALYDEGDANAFWDQSYYDQDDVCLASCAAVVVFQDPFNGGTPTTQQKADKLQAALNALAVLARIKAFGVNVVAYLPTSLS